MQGAWLRRLIASGVVPVPCTEVSVPRNLKTNRVSAAYFRCRARPAPLPLRRTPQAVPTPAGAGPNELMAAALPGGEVVLNARDAGSHERLISRSWGL